MIDIDMAEYQYPNSTPLFQIINIMEKQGCEIDTLKYKFEQFEQFNIEKDYMIEQSNIEKEYMIEQINEQQKQINQLLEMVNQLKENNQNPLENYFQETFIEFSDNQQPPCASESNESEESEESKPKKIKRFMKSRSNSEESIKAPAKKRQAINKTNYLIKANSEKNKEKLRFLKGIDTYKSNNKLFIQRKTRGPQFSFASASFDSLNYTENDWKNFHQNLNFDENTICACVYALKFISESATGGIIENREEFKKLIFSFHTKNQWKNRILNKLNKMKNY